MFEYYTLDEDKNAIPLEGDGVDACRVWGRLFQEIDHTVARTEISPGITVSTVFLGMNHNFGHGPPLIFETMIFGGSEDGWQARYSTWDEAVEGHAEAVEIARNS